jgi:hypothetical protein
MTDLYNFTPRKEPAMTVHNVETMKSERDTTGLIEALKHPGDASVRCTAAKALEPTH